MSIVSNFTAKTSSEINFFLKFQHACLFFSLSLILGFTF